jgi:hypothetical protein
VHVDSSVRRGGAGQPTRDLYRLIEHASDYVAAIDAEGCYRYVSPSG